MQLSRLGRGTGGTGGVLIKKSSIFKSVPYAWITMKDSFNASVSYETSLYFLNVEVSSSQTMITLAGIAE